MWTHLCLHGSGQRSCPCGEHSLIHASRHGFRRIPFRFILDRYMRRPPAYREGQRSCQCGEHGEKNKASRRKIGVPSFMQIFLRFCQKHSKTLPGSENAIYGHLSEDSPCIHGKVPFSLTEKMFPMDKWIRGQDDKLIK